jgi:hypothetical protein
MDHKPLNLAGLPSSLSSSGSLFVIQTGIRILSTHPNAAPPPIQSYHHGIAGWGRFVILGRGDEEDGP